MRTNHESMLYLVTKEPTVNHPRFVSAPSRTFVFRTLSQARRFKKVMTDRLTKAFAKTGKRPYWRYTTPAGASWGPDVFTKQPPVGNLKFSKGFKLIPVTRPAGENLLKKQGRPTTLKQHVKRLAKKK